jgi:preprotein translocase subunit SecB
MAEEQAPQPHFSIQKLYIKDSSFESPDAPKAFGYTEWKPNIELNLNNAHTKIEENLFEVVLTVTATVNHDDKVACLVEVQQAGLFGISGFNETDLKYLLGSQCMGILFPYAREVVSDLSNRGGFPPLVLSPVNFDALFQQHMQQEGGESVAQTDEQEQLSEAPEDTKH